MFIIQARIASVIVTIKRIVEVTSWIKKLYRLFITDLGYDVECFPIFEMNIIDSKKSEPYTEEKR